MTTEPLPEEPASSRFDPFFKVLTRLEAEQLGLQMTETELQITTKRGDLILKVPPGLSLEGTMFHFFRLTNVVEFKSESDQFNLREYAKNQMRTDFIFLQEKHNSYDNILNVIVSSRLPRKFLNYAKSEGVRFRRDKEKPWLWRTKVGFQNVIIVVCLDLPLEELYYNWLIFAPANSQKWKEYLRLLAKEEKRDLLEIAKKLRPKEFDMTIKDIDKLLEAEGLVTSPELQAQIDKAEETYLKYKLRRLKLTNPKGLNNLLSSLELEEQIAKLKPEERAELLKQLLAEQAKEEQA